MMQETTYEPIDLKSGTCTSCGEFSNEILIGDDRCVDCIETEKFIEMTMREGLPPDER
jgi:hypothetical protein